jgi:hypothetical protein
MDVTVVQAQIDSADPAIDRLDYELYELTDRPIRTVEGCAVSGP